MAISCNTGWEQKVSTLSLLREEVCFAEIKLRLENRHSSLHGAHNILLSVTACKLIPKFPVNRSGLDCITASLMSYKCHLTTDVTCLFSRMTS